MTGEARQKIKDFLAYKKSLSGKTGNFPPASLWGQQAERQKAGCLGQLYTVALRAINLPH
jgi:hypothetical protein